MHPPIEVVFICWLKDDSLSSLFRSFKVSQIKKLEQVTYKTFWMKRIQFQTITCTCSKRMDKFLSMLNKLYVNYERKMRKNGFLSNRMCIFLIGIWMMRKNVDKIFFTLFTWMWNSSACTSNHFTCIPHTHTYARSKCNYRGILTKYVIWLVPIFQRHEAIYHFLPCTRLHGAQIIFMARKWNEMSSYTLW